MRSEQVMTDLILGFAKDEERIRAVIMNGSRVNPDAPRDRFQDYDIVYVVTQLAGFVNDRSWISRFGELMIMQTPDDMEVPEPSDSVGRESFAFLMQFADGNRIDLTLLTVEAMANTRPDSLSQLLLDKDGIITPFPPPSSSDYRTIPPTAKQFANCCNEFWWVSTYIAKGLWRRELAYAKYMVENPVRDMLILMLKWGIGVQTNFTADPGKLGKYLEKHLKPEHWNAFKQTYADADYEHMWDSLFVMGDLFRETALRIANHYDYPYPNEDDRRVTAYLKHVRTLPSDAVSE